LAFGHFFLQKVELSGTSGENTSMSKEPSEKDRWAVETMAGHGIPQRDIARVIGISVNTLQRWYQVELDTGPARANSMVAQSLFDKALSTSPGAVTACIFWLKCRAGWVEPRPNEAAPGRKELQQKAAETAGGAGTEWASDLEVNQVN
jgi:hypothetical protein